MGASMLRSWRLRNALTREPAPTESLRQRWRRDSRTLLALARPAPRKASLTDWLNHFYAPQANDYDDFRDRMLHGRQELVLDLRADPGSVWVELGAGTG